jgi:hypothetical protein
MCVWAELRTITFDIDITAIYVFTGDFMVDGTVDKIVFITFCFCCAPSGAGFEA